LMADQQISQSGQSPSQPNTSETHLEVVDDPPGIFDSALWVESGLLPETTGIKRKRESSTESEDELEDVESGLNHPWDVESLCGLKMKLKKRRMDLVQPEHHEVFNRLLEDPVVKRFLAWDKNLRVSDKVRLFSSVTDPAQPGVGRLIILSSGCGAEIALLFPRRPGRMEA
uniref:Uncharacterized protein n=1 Tax=Urocitellus parryii TaxID=9999 RepID=A0A8D2H3Y0_UROPR